VYFICIKSSCRDPVRVKFVGYHLEESHLFHICKCSLINISYTVDIGFKGLTKFEAEYPN